MHQISNSILLQCKYLLIMLGMMIAAPLSLALADSPRVPTVMTKKVENGFSPLTRLRNDFVVNDPVRFTLQANKQIVRADEEIELTITAELLNISSQLMFFQEGSNAFSMKLLTPSGFIRSDGSETNPMEGTLSTINPRMAYRIKGKFISTSEGSCFRLLRSERNPTAQSRYVEKATLCFLLQGDSNERTRSKATTATAPYILLTKKVPSNTKHGQPIGVNNIACSDPTIYIASPGDYSTLLASSFPFYFTIQMTVCAPQGVSYVQYFITDPNGGYNYLGYANSPGSDPNYPYTFTASMWQSQNAYTISQTGTYILHAKLYMDDGNSIDASPVHVTINQTSPSGPPTCPQPSISVIQPGNNSTLYPNNPAPFPFFFDIIPNICIPQGASISQVQYNITDPDGIGHLITSVQTPDSDGSYALRVARWRTAGEYVIYQTGTYTITPRLFLNGGSYIDATPVQFTIGAPNNAYQPGPTNPGYLASIDHTDPNCILNATQLAAIYNQGRYRGAGVRSYLRPSYEYLAQQASGYQAGPVYSTSSVNVYMTVDQSYQALIISFDGTPYVYNGTQTVQIQVPQTVYNYDWVSSGYLGLKVNEIILTSYIINDPMVANNLQNIASGNFPPYNIQCPAYRNALLDGFIAGLYNLGM